MAAAVTGFQEKYRSEILDPIGLAHGTGYVGARTRVKLNALYGCSAITPPVVCPMDTKLCPDGSYVGRVPPNCAFAACPVVTTTTQPAIISIEPSSGPIGTNIALSVTGPMGHDNHVWMANGTQKGLLWSGDPPLVNLGNQYIEVTLPAKLCQQYTGASGLPCSSWMEVTPGVYEIYLENQYGKSNSVNFTVTSLTTQPAIFIISPASGDTWTIGETYYIKLSAPFPYDYAGITTSFTLVDQSGRSSLGAICEPQKGKSVISWRAGYLTSWCSGTDATEVRAEPGVYKLVLRHLGADGKELLRAESGWFKLITSTTTPLPSITVLSPNGGETWQVGSTQTISWRSENLKSDTWVGEVNLYKGNTFLMGLVPSLSKLPTTGSIQWKVPTTNVTGDDFKVEVRVFSGPTWTGGIADVVSDFSDRPFSIVAATAAQPSILSGLCTRLSSAYGNTFVDVDAGSISVGGRNYIVNGSQGITAGANQTINFYAYVPDGQSTGYIGTAVVNSQEAASLQSRGVLVATVQSGSNPTNSASQYGGIIQSITSYVPGCSNYTRPTPIITVLYPAEGGSYPVNGPGSVSWTETPGSANASFSIAVTAVSSASYPTGATVLSTTLTPTQAGCVTSDKCSYPITIGFPGTYSVTVTDNNTKGGVSSRVSFIIVAATQPTLSSFSASPTSVNSGGTVTFSFSGTNIGYYNFYLFCPVNVSAVAQGVNICNTNQRISGGYNEYSVQFSNTGTNAMLVPATLYAYDSNGNWVDQKTVSINVIQAGGVGQSASFTQLASTLESMKALLEELSRLIR
jgi:hypothetical protein